ncbi:MAG: hypothetical protein KF830_13680 [Planctomycetes bacterium]|nr:hypothetical protein [Planctomycetota bacterium]
MCLPGLYLAAQQPAPEPVPKPAEPPAVVQPAEPEPKPPADEAKAAAEMLRKRLGLQPGPQEAPPPGPPVLPPAPPDATPTTAPDPQEPQAPAAQGQEPAPTVDPTEAARRAMQRLLPTAQPPAAAPLPNATGTPEPLAPGAAGPGLRAAPPTEVGLPWSGQLYSRYRVRHGAGATDQDLIARLTVDVGRSDRDDVTFHFSGRGFVDIDGRRANDPFPGLDHSFQDRVNGRLYRAHVDFHSLPHVELARLGRQDLNETPVPLTFDGLRVDSERFGSLRAWLSAYGGVTVHQFEASSRGDAVFGMAFGLQPWTGARVRFDGMDLRDEYLAVDRQNGLIGARWWQALGAVQLNGLHTWVDGRARDLQLGARGEVESAVRFTVDYRGLLTTQRAQVTELDLYFDIAADYRPYQQVSATVGTDLGTFATIDVGADVRRLDESSDEGRFNREFERLHADLTLLDLGTRGLSLTVSGSLWDSTGESMRTVAGDLEYRPNPDLRLVLGTAYDLFRYDPIADRERLHVRSYYLRLDHRVDVALRVDGGYDYERDDFDEWHTFRLGMTWTF